MKENDELEKKLNDPLFMLNHSKRTLIILTLLWLLTVLFSLGIDRSASDAPFFTSIYFHGFAVFSLIVIAFTTARKQREYNRHQRKEEQER